VPKDVLWIVLRLESGELLKIISISKLWKTYVIAVKSSSA